MSTVGRWAFTLVANERGEGGGVMSVIVSGRRATGLGGLNRKVLFYAMGAVREHVGGVYLMGTLGANLVCLGMEFARRKLGILRDNASFKGQFSKGERLRQPPSSEINHC